MKDLIPADIKLPVGVIGHLNGLDIPPDLPFKDWGNLIKGIEAGINSTARRASVLQCWLADAINFGEAAYGEKYSQLVDQTGYKEGSLANVAWVGREVPKKIRHPELSWYHYRAVAPLGDQNNPAIEEKQKWLALAVQEDWSASELNRQVERARITAQGQDPDEYEAARAVSRSVKSFQDVQPTRWAEIVWNYLIRPLGELVGEREWLSFLAKLKQLIGLAKGGQG